MQFIINATSMDDLKTQLQAFLSSSAPSVNNSLPVVGFPTGSIFHPGNAMGTQPTVITPDGKVHQATVSIGSDGKEYIIPFVPTGPAITEGPKTSAANATFLASVQAESVAENAQRQAGINAASK